ncbi:SPARC- modular calcium-binding protein 2 [Maudiozyma exigua]|uniref:SPARC- modular calcium-binding protein 2 n=1 Tax=Maudiozyma exigua TaxID=34358 RepID=A0A9P6W998_MAUEX|nr:SPARC- modular calcium-binding protein 2 [Kazachstania exigua]
MKFVPSGKFSRARTHAQVKDNRRNLYGSSNGYYDDEDEELNDYRESDNGFDDGRYGSSRSSHGRSHGGTLSGGHRYDEGNVQESLKDIINSSDNRNRCGECQATFPTWCSINLGIFLCGRCASVHRKLLTNRSDEVYSNLKSVSLDRWTSKDLNELRRLGGNKGNSQFWNPKGEPFPFDGDDDKSQVEMFIRDKYINGRFKYEPVRPEDFGNVPHRHNSNSSRNDRSGDRSDSNKSHYHSRPSSRTNSREGYSNSNSNDTRNETFNSTTTVSAERNPQLPKRRPTVVGGRPAVFDGTSDMATQQAQAQIQAQVTGIPQQYLDPATGIIYVDQQQQAAIQQQALAQQQQQAVIQQKAIAQQQAMAQQQQQAAIQQQVQKNSIMNLYQRPDLYTTPVEITNTHPLYNQMTAQQLQQQQQQQQQYYTGQPFM